LRPRIEQLEARQAPAVSILTYHGDNFSSGQNANETALTPANVDPSTFGKLFATPLDGMVFAQPLYVPGINIAGQGMHNVVYVATEHNSLYAIDANNGQVLWHDSFINPAAGVTTVPNQDVGSIDVQPEIGITSTPVIDPNTRTLYLTAKTKEVTGGNTHYVYRLHAIDITSGAEKFGGPVVIGDIISNDRAHYTYVSGPFVNGTGAGVVDNVTTFDGGHTAVDGKVVFN